jgi:hypothetical protein
VSPPSAAPSPPGSVHRLLRGLDLTVAALVAAFPPAAVAGVFVRFALGRPRPQVMWVLLWLPFGLPILVQLATPGHRRAGLSLLLHVAFAMAIGAAARLPPRAIVVGGTASLLILAVLAVGDRWQGAHAWYPLAPGATEGVGAGLVRSSGRIVGGEGDRAVRTWALHGDVTRLHMALELRMAAAMAVDGEEDVGDVVSLHVQWPGTRIALPIAHPAADWGTASFVIEDPRLAAASFVQLVLQVVPGRSVDIGSVSVRADGAAGAAARPLTTRPRVRLWFGHFNLLGHGVALWAVVVMTVALTRRAWGAYAVVALLGLVVVLATGSRAAGIAMAVATLLHVVELADAASPNAGGGRGPRGPFGRSAWIGAGVLTLAVAAAALTFALRPDGGFGVARTTIWAVATEALLERPWTGSAGSFADAFMRRSPAAPEEVGHAHNFWLDAGFRFGWPGLVASLLTTTALFAWAWRGARWRGAAIVSACLTLQVVDLTLWTAHVLLPLTLGLDAVVHDRGPPAEPASTEFADHRQEALGLGAPGESGAIGG